MKYFILLAADPADEPQPGTPEFDAMMGEYFTLEERTKGIATVLSGEALYPAETSRSVKKRGGQIETMDGPFAETREQLGGYYLIDAKDMEAALAFAAEIPAARYGTVEVRPVLSYG
jgi:hypothetical protein